MMPPYPLPDTDPSYTMQPGSFDPQGAVPKMDPGSMSRLFGDDNQGGGDQAGDQAGATTAEEADGQDTDQAQGPPDQGKLQSVLSDPGMLMSVAQVLKTLGTGDDTDLVHVTDREKQILKRAGGKGTVNPTTGLLQYAPPNPNDPAPAGIDWYNMHPDARVAHIGSMYQSPPGWSRNWWSTPDATQGGMTRNITGAEYASMNSAVNPSWGNALGMAGLVGALGFGGPVGLAMKMGGMALSNAVLGKSDITDPFADPGPSLSADAQARVEAAYNQGGPVAGNRQLGVERDAAHVAAGGQIGGPGPDKSAGIGVDRTGAAYGSNIGGAGISHNAAAGIAAAGAAGNVDKGSGTAGGGGGAGGGGSDGGGGGGGGPGGHGPSDK